MHSCSLGSPKTLSEEGDEKMDIDAPVGEPGNPIDSTVKSHAEETLGIEPVASFQGEISTSTALFLADIPSDPRKQAMNHRDLGDGSEYPVDAAKCKALIQKLTGQEYGWMFSLPVDSTQPGLERFVLPLLPQFSI